MGPTTTKSLYATALNEPCDKQNNLQHRSTKSAGEGEGEEHGGLARGEGEMDLVKSGVTPQIGDGGKMAVWRISKMIVDGGEGGGLVSG